MRVKFIKADFEYTLNNIVELIEMKDGDYFVEAIFQYYPNIMADEVLSFSHEKRKEYLREKLQEVLEVKEKEIDEKVIEYQKYWDDNGVMIISKLEDIFGIKLSGELNNVIGQVGLNPICPRFLDSSTFDIFYLLNNDDAFEIVIHEIVHFIWFKIWNNYYKDDYSEYESPNLKWIFSEIAISPILSDYRMKEYIDLKEPAYKYFYNINVNGENLMKLIHDIYNNNCLIDFIKEGFKLCKKYEAEIRKSMY